MLRSNGPSHTVIQMSPSRSPISQHLLHLFPVCRRRHRLATRDYQSTLSPLQTFEWGLIDHIKLLYLQVHVSAYKTARSTHIKTKRKIRAFHSNHNMAQRTPSDVLATQLEASGNSNSPLHDVTPSGNDKRESPEATKTESRSPDNPQLRAYSCFTRSNKKEIRAGIKEQNQSTHTLDRPPAITITITITSTSTNIILENAHIPQSPQVMHCKNMHVKYQGCRK